MLNKEDAMFKASLVAMMFLLGCSDGSAIDEAPDAGPDAAPDAGSTARYDAGSPPPPDAGTPDAPSHQPTCDGDGDPKPRPGVTKLGLLSRYTTPAEEQPFVVFESQGRAPVAVTAPCFFFRLPPGRYSAKMIDRQGHELAKTDMELPDNGLVLVAIHSNRASGPGIVAVPVDLSPLSSEWRVQLVNLAEDTAAPLDLYAYAEGSAPSNDEARLIRSNVPFGEVVTTTFAHRLGALDFVPHSVKPAGTFAQPVVPCAAASAVLVTFIWCETSDPYDVDEAHACHATTGGSSLLLPMGASCAGDPR
jgi:hypothetical protein